MIDSQIIASGSQGTNPVPRYGNTIVLDRNGILTIFGGSGSMYLNDVVQIDTQEEEESDTYVTFHSLIAMLRS